MKSPIHPGLLVRHECLEALNLSVTEAAKVLGVARPTLSNLINGKAAISPEMAIRLHKAFGGTPEIWLKMQLAYDLAQAKSNASAIQVKRYKPKSQANYHH